MMKKFWLIFLAGLVGGASLRAQTVEELTTKAQQGDVQAEFLLGRAYFQGEGVAKDEAKGIELFRKAAEKGYFKAQHNLGLAYLEGRGVKADPAEAVVWFRKSAEQGTIPSQLQLAGLLLQGRSVDKNIPEAVVWYEKAASQDNANAQAALGEIYYFGGEGVDKDYAKAAQWLSKAVKQNQIASANILGVLYVHGLGVEKNVPEGLKLLNTAAEKGSTEAQANLGRYYYIEAENPDLARAYYWLKRSSKAGEPSSFNYLTELQRVIQPEQIAEGERLLQEAAK